MAESGRIDPHERGRDRDSKPQNTTVLELVHGLPVVRVKLAIFARGFTFLQSAMQKGKGFVVDSTKSKAISRMNRSNIWKMKEKMTKSNEFFNFLEKLASGLQLFQIDAKVGIQICADT